MRKFFDNLGSRFFNGRNAEAAPAPKLSDARRFPYGPFSFHASVAEGATFTILASTDLVTWISLTTGTAGKSPVDYLDINASKYSQRFYRVLADETPSENVLGFVSMTLAPGFSLIGNPLRCASNSIGELFAKWPNETSLHKFDTRLFRLTEASVAHSRWSRPEETLSPGEGAIFFNPTNDYKAHSFAGEIMLGNLSTPVPAGFSLRSSLVPQSGNLADDLRFPIGDGDEIHLFDRDRQKYVIYPFAAGKWKNGAPVIGAGEAFWVAKKEPANWNRDLQIAAPAAELLPAPTE